MDQVEIKVETPKRGVRHLIGNTLSLITNDMVNRVITFVVYALIARFLGVYEFGQMSLTLTIFYLLQGLAPVGLKILLVREISKDKERTGEYLASGSVVALLSSVLALILLYLFLVFSKYSTDTVWIILIISAALIPYSTSAVCEAVLQAHEKIRLITYANIPISILRGLAAYILLSLGYPLIYIAVLFVASFVFTFVVEWILVSRFIVKPKWKLDTAFILQISKTAAAFLGLQTLIAVTGSIIPLVISFVSTEVEVGLFNAANQLMSPILMVIQSVVMSLFPRLCLKYEAGSKEFKRTTERLLEILATFSIPMAIGLFYFSQPVLLLLYGKEDFVQSVPVLQLMVWILFTRSVTSVLGRVLLASNRERTLLTVMIIEVVVILVLSTFVIPTMKLTGAALVALGVGILDVVLHLVVVRPIFGWLDFGRILWKPVVATTMMAIWIVFSNSSLPVNQWLSILVSTAVFSATWIILAISENGSWMCLKKHYLGAG